MSWYEILAAVCAGLAALALVVCVPVLIIGGRAEVRAENFDRHVADDLNMIAADDRNTRLNANANGTGWY